MKSLDSSTPAVIMVTGLPGTGKTFFATRFAKTFGIAVVSIDKIRWTLFANHTYSDNENAMVQQVANLIVTELLKTQKSFVVDGGFNTEIEREEFISRFTKAGFRVVIVVVQVDDSTAKLRSAKRSAKDPENRYKQSLSSEEFEEQVARYEMPRIDKKTVVISGKHTYPTQARNVLGKLLETKDVPIIIKPKPLHGSPPPDSRRRPIIQ